MIYRIQTGQTCLNDVLPGWEWNGYVPIDRGWKNYLAKSVIIVDHVNLGRIRSQ